MNAFMQPPTLGEKAAPRNCSVGMGRIDEDRPCDFEEDCFNAKADFLYIYICRCVCVYRFIY